MNNNLLIVGAGIYGVVAKEIAESMNCFEKIAFVDDEKKETPNGIEVIGTCADIEKLTIEYSNIFVAIDNPEVRLSLIQKIEEEIPCAIATLVSPRAYVAPSAQILYGSIIEPMVVVHTGALISKGCIISAGAVINHTSMCAHGVHIDCNATVVENMLVPAGTKVCCGEVFRKEKIDTYELFFDAERWGKALASIAKSKPYGPIETDDLKYSFEDGM